MNNGERIGAILGVDKGTLKLLGYGVYEGDFVPDETVDGPMAEHLRQHNLPNPRFKLDDGQVVYGCQCSFGPEEDIKRRVALYGKVENVKLPLRQVASPDQPVEARVASTETDLATQTQTEVVEEKQPHHRASQHTEQAIDKATSATESAVVEQTAKEGQAAKDDHRSHHRKADTAKDDGSHAKPHTRKAHAEEEPVADKKADGDDEAAAKAAPKAHTDHGRKKRH